ncbi:helix-turn-helix transcriptional regulator [Orbus sturtevantii]|uniref:XRE family transcriptional regulator n=1 Tax=Orbus sturtevantii TaxID=3074109 RepID=UPI00370D0DE3
MTFADRLNKAMSLKGYTQGKLAQKVGMAQSSVWKLTSGEAKSSRRIIDIAAALNINPTWLSTGEGVMDADVVKLSELKYNQASEWDSNTPLHDDEVEVPYFKSIELAAGHGAVSGEDYNGHKLRFGKSFFRRKGAQKENVICFPVYGDSMEPKIPNGSTVAVDSGKKDVIDGDIYAICQGDLCRLKRLYRMPNNKIRINSFNSIDHPDEIDDISNIQIIGRVFHYAVEL